MTAATQGGSVHNASRPAPSGRGRWRGMRRGMLRLIVLDTGSSPGFFPLGPVPKVRSRSSLFTDTRARRRTGGQRALGGA